MNIFNFNEIELIELNAQYTAKEIHQQPNTWLKTYHQIRESKNEIELFLHNVLNCDDYEIILTGAGTSEFVGNAIFSYLNRVNKCSNFKSVATTDLVHSPLNYLNPCKKTLLVSYGRSGNSPESIGAYEIANKVLKDNVYHLFITCNKNGALSKAALHDDHAYAVLLADETCDQSFAMTSSFTNMYLASILIFNLNRLDELKDELLTVINNGNLLINQDYDFAYNLVTSYDFKRIVYLGANCLKGVSQESALKMLELTAGKCITMYDSVLGFRHGPKSIIDDQTLCVIYLSDDAYQHQYELDLIKEISSQRKGNKLCVIGHKSRAEIKDLVDYYYDFEASKELDNVLLGLNYIMIAQLIALYKSLSLDIGPDNPCPSGEVNRVVKGVVIYDYK